MMTHANRALGVAVIRTALVATVIITMRHQWPRALSIAACGCAAVFGRLTGDASIERVGFRLVLAPMAALICAAIGFGFFFDILIIAIGSGIIEISESKTIKFGIFTLAAIVRWFFKARIWFFLKLIAFELFLLPLSFIFFQLAGHAANEILNHALDKLALQVREEFNRADAEISALKNNHTAHQDNDSSTNTQSGPYRRNKKHH
uniref:Uncharacterized protein n=1 Tax=Aureoumbra lagunensis TaxID=44058 RepID=A0A7S3NKZ9_9STRA|mmetsp:Transcript_13583/g.16422  ORF Transcript_13583/g.16422 Transcript_13583/m.16422 type:complete len:205 (+) Transcript_13583:310-924(+)